MWSKRQYGYCLKVTLQIGQEWVCSLWSFLLVNSSSQWSHIISSSVNGWLFCVLCFFSASTSWVLSTQTCLASSPKILPFFWACWASNWDLAIDYSACFLTLFDINFASSASSLNLFAFFLAYWTSCWHLGMTSWDLFLISFSLMLFLLPQLNVWFLLLQLKLWQP